MIIINRAARDILGTVVNKLMKHVLFKSECYPQNVRLSPFSGSHAET